MKSISCKEQKDFLRGAERLPASNFCKHFLAAVLLVLPDIFQPWQSTMVALIFAHELNCFVFSNAGPFTEVNAEEVEEEVSGMWRTMYKLTKSFSDVPGPKRIAESVKTKIDKFKAHLPLLQTICNPGIRDRHWDLVSD